MNYSECLSFLAFLRPRVKTVSGLRDLSVREVEILERVDGSNRFIPQYLSELYAIEPCPANFSKTLLRIVSLDHVKFHDLLLRLGLTLGYFLVESNQEVISYLENLDEEIAHYAQRDARRYGEFYEPYSREVLKNFYFDIDRLRTDLMSFGYSIIIGYLKKRGYPVENAIKFKANCEIDRIDRIVDIPINNREDATSKIMNKLMDKIIDRAIDEAK